MPFGLAIDDDSPAGLIVERVRPLLESLTAWSGARSFRRLASAVGLKTLAGQSSRQWHRANEPRRHKGHNESTLRQTKHVSELNSLCFLFSNIQMEGFTNGNSFCLSWCLGAFVVNNPDWCRAGQALVDFGSADRWRAWPSCDAAACCRRELPNGDGASGEVSFASTASQ